MTQATKRPLYMKHEFGMITVSDANGKTCFSWHSYKENVELAELIVKAVNERDELIEALKRLFERCKDLEDQGPAGYSWQSDKLIEDLELSKKALSKAESEA